MTNQQSTKRVTITTDGDGKNVVIRNSQTGEVIPMVESCSIHIDASTVVPRASLTVWNPSIDITCDAEVHENDIEKQEETIAFKEGEQCTSDRLKDALARIADLELQLKQRLHEETQQRKPLSDEYVDNAAEQAYGQFDARRKGDAEFRGHPRSERDAFKAEAHGLAKGYFPARVD